VRAAQLAEIVSPVQSQGGQVVGQEIYHLSEPNPRTLLGTGTAQAIADRARAAGATMLVLDAELSPRKCATWRMQQASLFATARRSS
jgi:GTP-binding protein HflX